jgi:hypothetical protein
LRPPPPRVASLHNLIAEINNQSAGIRSLSATLDLQPTEGSVYSGVIKQYHDVRGAILLERPAWIRIQGQVPVVGTDLFDMTSDGQHFDLYIPPKNTFYEGADTVTGQLKNSLNALRPEQIVDALFLDPIRPNEDSYFLEESQHGIDQDYVVGVLDSGGKGEVTLERKIWFDRTNMQIVRVQMYGKRGKYAEEVSYANYVNFGVVHFPSRIMIRRPDEGISLGITILQAKFNQPIPQSKFLLAMPPGTRRVIVSSSSSSRGPDDP